MRNRRIFLVETLCGKADFSFIILCTLYSTVEPDLILQHSTPRALKLDGENVEKFRLPERPPEKQSIQSPGSGLILRTMRNPGFSTYGFGEFWR